MKMKKFAKLLNFLAIVQTVFFMNGAHAQDYFRASQEKTRFSLKGNEFLSGQDYGDTLMRVSLLGAVGKPGMHMVPANSSFASLLSYAGGPTVEADVENISIKRGKKGNYEVLEYDLKEFMKDPSKKDLTLRPNDIVYVPQKDKFLSEGALRALTITSTILGIIVSGMVIDDRL